jgi:hypothetical protein
MKSPRRKPRAVAARCASLRLYRRHLRFLESDGLYRSPEIGLAGNEGLCRRDGGATAVRSSGVKPEHSLTIDPPGRIV